ncbi:MAG: phosphoribosylformylglycinamidine synthase [Clostridia bacterium]|nr:phosphoribosylformylglycinamidine synthase [Clostridia bacterium]
MANVLRLFVEKKSGFDIEAGHTLSDLRENLGLSTIDSLRIINRYDIEGLSECDFERSGKNVLSEPNVDILSYSFKEPKDAKVFAIEYLPGQYDQRADSAAQCIALLTQGEQPKVICAKIYVISGNISDSDFKKIQEYIINPLESRLASMDIPATLDLQSDVPDDVERVLGFVMWSDGAVEEYHKQMGFAMSVLDLCFCRDYFRDTENRDPSLTELKVIDTYWSDHCRHTTFLTSLDNVDIEKGPLAKAIESAWIDYIVARTDVYGERKKNMTLMDIATIGTKVIKKRGLANDLDESEEINACSINVDVEVDGESQKWLVQFKNETHNHPTEIEPYGGAATCLGGSIRDPLSGRAYVYQAMRVTGSGNPCTAFEDTLEGKLPQKKITVGAAQGYSSYGNQIGLSTGQVVELYDEGYVAKRMEIGAVIGASPKNNVKRLEPQTDDVIVLLGGRTGRDGCGGATGSSKAHNSSSIENCGAEVQKGNPPTERKIQRLFRNPKAAYMIKRCNDFGAGGVCVAIGELAPGLEINLDCVKKKYDGLDGTELAISESQERMAVVLDKADVDAFIALTEDENLETSLVAKVCDAPRLVMTWRGDKIVDLSREFLDTNGVTQHANVKIAAVDKNKNYRNTIPAVLAKKTNAQALRDNLARLEVCSQKGLVERFDSSIGATNVLMPFAGKYQLTPEEAMCSKIPLLEGTTDTASAMSYGFIPSISRWSPFHGAAFAVTESLAKLASIGTDPFKSRLTLQEYFEKINGIPERWGKPTAALLGALEAQLNFNVPAIGGKDSMSGSFNDLDVPPTLVCFAVSMTQASKTVSSIFKKSGSKVVFLPLPIDSETLLPDWDKTKVLFTNVYEKIRNGQFLAASVVKEGGSAACVCKMAFGNKQGFKFNDNLDAQTLFAPLCASFVVELADNANLNGIEYIELGSTCDCNNFAIDGDTIPVNELINNWAGTLEGVFATKASNTPKMQPEIALFNEKTNKSPAIKSAKPKVIIPAFPGTNCEVDTARAFEIAGAEAEIIVVKNLSASDIEETIERLVKSIKNSQILMIPGGFSGGDEPDGSGKFIATTLKNARVMEAVTELLENRDGLVLGICNGFQALIKTGLLPYGKICETKETDPTLTFNYIGRHVSTMTYTRITSVKSPWLSGVNAGDVHCVPVSHGEGRFVADDAMLKMLVDNGQIATQYVDLDSNPSADIRFNPNGSVCAIEGITSPDGRVFGKMGHSERCGINLYGNVPGEKDQKIFQSGVAYFK